jgi:hypothetical protein
LIRADFEVAEGILGDVSLSGDFFCFPDDAVTRLEAKLEGRPIEETRALVEGFYSDKEIDTPGIGIEDWLQVLDAGAV